MDSAQYQVVCGDASQMDMVRDQEADLVLTSPPYFPSILQERLEQPQPKQTDFSEVRSAVVSYARSLEPVFREIARVLRPGRAAILQTKDLRYGGSLIGLAGIHREMMEDVGFRLVTQVFWRKSFLSHDPTKRFLKNPMLGSFRSPSLEMFLIFGIEGVLEERPNRPELEPKELAACSQSVWQLPSARDRQAHRHASPPAVIRRLIALYTEPGDLIVDPFLGHGTTIKLAIERKRRAIGYDVDPDCVEATDRWILGKGRSK